MSFIIPSAPPSSWWSSSNSRLWLWWWWFVVKSTKQLEKVKKNIVGVRKWPERDEIPSTGGEVCLVKRKQSRVSVGEGNSSCVPGPTCCSDTETLQQHHVCAALQQQIPTDQWSIYLFIFSSVSNEMTWLLNVCVANAIKATRHLYKRNVELLGVMFLLFWWTPLKHVEDQSISWLLSADTSTQLLVRHQPIGCKYVKIKNYLKTRMRTVPPLQTRGFHQSSCLYV